MHADYVGHYCQVLAPPRPHTPTHSGGSRQLARGWPNHVAFPDIRCGNLIFFPVSLNCMTGHGRISPLDPPLPAQLNISGMSLSLLAVKLFQVCLCLKATNQQLSSVDNSFINNCLPNVSSSNN